MISREDRAVFDAALAKFKAEHREIEAQVGIWLDLALDTFGDYIGEIREDATPEQRAEGLPIVAGIAILETAAAWQRTCRKARKARAA